MKEIGLYILIGLTIISLHSCASYNIEKVVGNYENQWEYTGHKLELFKDSSFIFYVAEELLQDTIKGTWKINGRQIFLIRNEYKPYYVNNECKTCISYNLSTYDSKTRESIPIHYKAFYKDTLKKEGYTDLNGVATISETIDSLYLKSLEYEGTGFRVADKKSYIEAFLLKSQNNEILQYQWVLKGNEIIGSNGLVLKKRPNMKY